MPGPARALWAQPPALEAHTTDDSSGRIHLDQRAAVAVVSQVDMPRLTADLAVFDVHLVPSATGVETDASFLPRNRGTRPPPLYPRCDLFHGGHESSWSSEPNSTGRHAAVPSFNLMAGPSQGLQGRGEVARLHQHVVGVVGGDGEDAESRLSQRLRDGHQDADEVGRERAADA